MKRPDFQELLSPFPRMHPDDIRDKIPYLFPIYSYFFPKQYFLEIDCFDQDKAFGVLMLASAMEDYRSRPPQVNIDISESLGGLSALPRELRDEIYSYVLPRGHTLFWRQPPVTIASRYREPVNDFQSHSDTEEEEYTDLQILQNPLHAKDSPGSNLALLRLSKHIHEEAITLLYSQNTFRFFPSWNYPPSWPSWEPKYPSSTAIVALRRLPKPIHEKVTNFLYSQNPFGFFPAWKINLGRIRTPDNLPSAAVVDYITNVEFHLDWRRMRFMYSSKKSHRQLPFESILPGPITLFTGTETRRRSALIEIKQDDWSGYTTQMIPSPLFAAIGQLTGFRKVTVRLHCLYHCPVKGSSGDEVKYWVRKAEWGMVFGGLVDMMEASRVRLEPTLGRGVWGELVVPRYPSGWRDLVFCPGAEGMEVGVGEGEGEEGSGE